MRLIGLTGGVGMGKSTAADLLKQRGIPVVDTDQLARDVVEPGQPAFIEVKERFGPGIVAPDGRLDRKAVAELVFADPARRQQLESILHPRIRERWLAQAQQWRAQGRTAGVVVIPLLFETNAAGEFDLIVCVACSLATQRQRLLARGWTPEQIDQRIAAQMPVQKKIDLADVVIWTEGSLETHAAQWDKILAAPL